MKIKNMNEEEMVQFKTWLKESLNKGTVKVTFLKQDGSERVMNCTTSKTVTPAVTSPRTSADIMTVFDVDIKDWRSFRWDRVKEVEPIHA